MASRTLKFITYSPYIGIYFLQGAATAFVAGFQKPYLTQAGVSPEAIGALTAAFFLPFILKIFISHLSDKSRARGQGSRKLWIQAGLVATAVGFGLCGLFSPAKQFATYVVGALLSSLGMATCDSVTDGLAVETTPVEDEGFVQSSMFAGRALGAILFSPLLGYLISHNGYPASFVALTCAALLPLAVLRALPAEPPLAAAQSVAWRSVGKTFASWKFFSFCAYTILFSFMIYGSEGILTLFLKRSFLSSEETLGRFGGWKSLGTLIGAVTAGYAHTRLKIGRVALWGMASLAIGSFIMSQITQESTLLALATPWGFLSGFATTGFVSLAMHLTPTALAATIFSLFMAIANVGGAMGEGFSARWAIERGFHDLYIFYAGVAALAALILLLALRHISPKKSAHA